jgi:hypothetical protein
MMSRSKSMSELPTQNQRQKLGNQQNRRGPLSRETHGRTHNPAVNMVI